MEAHYESDLARSERVLDEVDRALERLSQGSYGSCDACGSPILADDLAADPTRHMCEQHLALKHSGTEAGGTGATPTTGPL